MHAFALVISSLSLVACGGSQTPVYSGPVTYGSIAYRLPVKGRWRVVRTHYANKNTDQAYAVDLIVDAPTPNSQNVGDYPSEGQPIVADGPGVVAEVVEGVPENVPPRENGYEQHGNMVVIDHRNGEYSLFAHMIPGSIKVHPGQYVNAGDQLGSCGNSGNTTMPHIHWQVMNYPYAQLAHAVPQRMAPYKRNGATSTQQLEANDVVEAQ